MSRWKRRNSKECDDRNREMEGKVSREGGGGYLYEHKNKRKPDNGEPVGL